MSDNTIELINRKIEEAFIMGVRYGEAGRKDIERYDDDRLVGIYYAMKIEQASPQLRFDIYQAIQTKQNNQL